MKGHAALCLSYRSLTISCVQGRNILASHACPVGFYLFWLVTHRCCAPHALVHHHHAAVVDHTNLGLAVLLRLALDHVGLRFRRLLQKGWPRKDLSLAKSPGIPLVLVFFIAAGGSIWHGLRYDDSTTKGFGLAFLGINLYTKLFEFGWGWSKPLFFAILAGTFALVGRYAEDVWNMRLAALR